MQEHCRNIVGISVTLPLLVNPLRAKSSLEGGAMYPPHKEQEHASCPFRGAIFKSREKDKDDETGSRCPDCGAILPHGTLVCTMCGWDA